MVEVPFADGTILVAAADTTGGGSVPEGVNVMARPDRDSAPTGGNHYVITLVHGTWARGAAWTRPYSLFCIVLEDELTKLGAESVEIIRDFEWSGKNTHEERRAAAVCLREKLYNTLRLHPNASHFVIGHSHGGNIALRAVSRSAYLQSRIQGTVCISTPFLRMRRRSVTWALMREILFMAAAKVWKDFGEALLNAIKYLPLSLVALPIGLIVGLVCYWFTGFWTPKLAFYNYLSKTCISVAGASICDNARSIYYAGTTALMAVYWGGFAWMESRERILQERGREYWRERKRSFLRYSYIHPEDPTRCGHVLSLSSPLDEALSVLKGSWWLDFGANFVGRLLSASFIVAALATVVAVVLGLMTVSVELSNFFAKALWDWMIGFVFLVTTAVLLFLTGLAVGCVLWLVSMMAIGLRLDKPEHNLWVSVRASRTAHEIAGLMDRRFGVLELLSGSRGLLFHSRVYSFEPAVRYTAQWIYGHVRFESAGARMTAPGAASPAAVRT